MSESIRNCDAYRTPTEAEQAWKSTEPNALDRRCSFVAWLYAPYMPPELAVYHTPQAALDVVRGAQDAAADAAESAQGRGDMVVIDDYAPAVADAATGRPLDAILANPPMTAREGEP